MTESFHVQVSRRLKGASLLSLAGSVLLVWRLFDLQVVQHEAMTESGRTEKTRNITWKPKRGLVLDRNQRLLVWNTEQVTLVAGPKRINHKPAELAALLAPLLAVSEETLRARLGSDHVEVTLKRSLSEETAAKVEAEIASHAIVGLDFRAEPNRHYVKGTLAGQVLGFVNIDNQGQAGIEKAEENHLTGREIQVLARRYNDKKVILDLDYMREVPLRGADVVLTLDETIQWIAERALGELCTEQNAKAGMAIVMEPNTGEVLAMANYPFFDPARVGEYATSGEMERAKNHCVANIYEPGSTMKPFVVAAGLDCGAIAPDSIIDCEGGRRYLPRGLRNTPIQDEHGMGRVPVTEVLVYSSNVGAGKIAEQIVNLDPEQPSKKRFVEYLRSFGFGTRTGIDLPGETGGVLSAWERWNLNDLLVTAFGTGPVMASPIGLAAAYCILANGGREVQPHVVKGYLANRNASLYPAHVGMDREVISKESARLVNEMLVQVVERGTGTRAKSDWYKVGGKTGTAKKVVNGVYSQSHRALSFAGFAPADPPRIVVVVIIDEPDELRFGGLAAAPVFRRIVDETLAYLHVTPDFSGPAPNPDSKGGKPGKRPAGRQPLRGNPLPEADEDRGLERESVDGAARVAAAESAAESARREQW